jgi:hypothetical protein
MAKEYLKKDSLETNITKLIDDETNKSHLLHKKSLFSFKDKS